MFWKFLFWRYTYLHFSVSCCMRDVCKVARKYRVYIMCLCLLRSFCVRVAWRRLLTLRVLDVFDLWWWTISSVLVHLFFFIFLSVDFFFASVSEYCNQYTLKETRCTIPFLLIWCVSKLTQFLLFVIRWKVFVIWWDILRCIRHQQSEGSVSYHLTSWSCSFLLARRKFLCTFLDALSWFFCLVLFLPGKVFVNHGVY